MYIIPEHNQTDKKRNVETLNLANAIKAQKILEIYNQAYGFNHKQIVQYEADWLYEINSRTKCEQ